MPHEIASIITCKLCPADKPTKLAGPTLVLGPGQSNRVGAFMQSMSRHIVNHHPQQYEYLQQKALEFMGLQTVMQYTTTDPNIRHNRDWLRWQIHQATLNARVPDEKLETKSREVATELIKFLTCADGVDFTVENPETLQKVTRQISDGIAAIVKIIRDELQEPVEPKPPAGVRV